MSENKTNRECVYTGQRIRGDKVVQRFELLPERKEMFFSGVSMVWIGSRYKCTEDKIKARPERIDAPLEERAEWEAEDALAKDFQRKRRAEAKVKKLSTPNLDRALNALKPLTAGLSFGERRALITLLVDKASDMKEISVGAVNVKIEQKIKAMQNAMKKVGKK